MKAVWILGTVALATCFAATAAGRLDIKLQNVQTAHTAAAGASVLVTMSNTGDQPIELTASYVPDVDKSGRLQTNLFKVMQEDGSPVDYRGIYLRNVRGSTPSLVLMPGQSIVKTIDLSLSYQIMPGRKYSVAVHPFVRYREQSESKSKSTSADMVSLKTATSNSIEIKPR
ncbi:hypothetical protein LL972_20640 [Xanthomonas campestris pv. asclepiadis]|uniref:hypothetical protein n=1 Tax=Xanthomonas campestris TaxID=339 RepID=UPI001E63F8CC|nr:hypothetical protein [Xanthomonas campestris]MCC4618370.1 hypothetical protein [Xanthomonas campestris pv. asclepiadis]